MMRICHKVKRKPEVTCTTQSWSNLNIKINKESMNIKPVKKIGIHEILLIINR